MRKILLNLEQLAVESFATVSPGAHRGTAFAHSDGWTHGAQCITQGAETCDCSAGETICGFTGPGYPLQCGDTSAGTCICEPEEPTDEPIE